MALNQGGKEMNIGFKGLTVAAGMVALATLAAPVGGQTPTTVTVNNTRDVSVTVYLERGDFDVRLGTVAPHTEGVLDLPSSVSGNEAVRFIVHPDGRWDLLSPELHVKHAGNVDLYVPRNDVGFIAPPPPEVILNPGEGTTTLTVENPRNEAVVIFIERGEFDTRIGSVPANGKETFFLHGALAENEHLVRIFVHPEHGSDLPSQLFELAHGAHLFVKVPVS